MADNLLRPIIKTDWVAISKIYAEGIKTDIATFETKIPDWDSWSSKYYKNCRIVSQIDNEISGFGVLSNVSNRDVYKGVAEVSIYIAEKHRGKGIGITLLNKIIEDSEKEGFWTLQASIFSQNNPSYNLFKKCGFRLVGVREKIGQLHGKWYDNYLLERRSDKI